MRQILVLFIAAINITLVIAASPSLSNRIINGLKLKYPLNEINRVLTCWDKFERGEKLVRYLDEEKEIHQQADCFVDGLTAVCFHDTSKWDWAVGLEQRYPEILDELKTYNKVFNVEETNLEDTALWLSARNSDAAKTYGPQWKTLALQDRGVWDEDNIKHFPRTVNIISELNVPCCEAFFAKQAPKSGIAPHSDKNNFIITSHLGLDVPEGECWIQVGNEKHYWKNGKTAAFDTSIIHSTQNFSEKPRYVLMIRFWHPELSIVEREAFTYIFDFLDHAALGEESLELFETMHLLMGKDKKPPVSKATVKAKKLQEEDALKSKRVKASASPKRGFAAKEKEGQKDKGPFLV